MAIFDNITSTESERSIYREDGSFKYLVEVLEPTFGVDRKIRMLYDILEPQLDLGLDEFQASIFDLRHLMSISINSYFVIIKFDMGRFDIGDILKILNVNSNICIFAENFDGFYTQEYVIYIPICELPFKDEFNKACPNLIDEDIREEIGLGGL